MVNPLQSSTRVQDPGQGIAINAFNLRSITAQYQSELMQPVLGRAANGAVKMMDPTLHDKIAVRIDVAQVPQLFTDSRGKVSAKGFKNAVADTMAVLTEIAQCKIPTVLVEGWSVSMAEAQEIMQRCTEYQSATDCGDPKTQRECQAVRPSHVASTPV